MNLQLSLKKNTVLNLLLHEIPVHIAERAGGESYLKPMVAVRYMARMLLSILLIQNFRNSSAMRRDRSSQRI